MKQIQKIKNIAKNYLMKNKLGTLTYKALKGLYILLNDLSIVQIIFRKKFSLNNNLGIFLTARCNLSCINCQTSAKQAPSNDILTVKQMRNFVNEAKSLKYYWDKIFITGGEPTLHPQFFEIIEILEKYKNFNPGCKFMLETNGSGHEVQSVLKQIPDWIKVHNTLKRESVDRYDFHPYNIAPIDTLTYRFFADFSKGCDRISICYGLCLSMYGFYPCSPCMNVDRVFGFDIGIKKLSQVNEKALRKQMKILCKYCGWFRKHDYRQILTKRVSRSWKKAFSMYKNNGLTYHESNNQKISS